jgi:hypothetical protein
MYTPVKIAYHKTFHIIFVEKNSYITVKFNANFNHVLWPSGK